MSIDFTQLLPFDYVSPSLTISPSKKPLSLEEKTSTATLGAHKNTFANSKYGRKKFRRQVFSSTRNLTPSVQSNCSAKNPLDPEMVIQHAYLRIQLLYIEAVARQGLGIRNDESKQEALNVTVSHARKQGGEGSKGNHAAHANAASGLADNMRDLICSQIQKEKQVTPKKRNIILHAARNCTEKHLELLTSSDDMETIFNSIWPKRYAEESLLESSRFHNIANTTHELPAALNLQCDSPLEQVIRPDVATLFRKVMFNELTPQAATQEYVNMILVHFDNVIPEIMASIANIEKYSAEWSTTFHSDNLDKLTETALKELEKKLMVLKDPEQIQTPISNWIPPESKNIFKINIRFLEKARQRIEKGVSNEGFSSWFTKNQPKAQKEISKILSLTKNILNYCEWEKKGTRLPEFEMLSGTYNKETNMHVMLSPESNKKFQMSLFRAQTPIKKIKKNPVTLFQEDSEDTEMVD